MGTLFLASGNAQEGRQNDKIDERPSLAIGLTGAFGSHATDFYTP